MCLLQVNAILWLQGSKGEIGVLGPPGPPGKKVLHPGVWHQRAHMHLYNALQKHTYNTQHFIYHTVQSPYG